MTKYGAPPLGKLSTVTSSKRIFLADYVAEGIPFYRSKEIIEKSLGQRVSTTLFIAVDKYEQIKHQYGSPNDGDILIAAVGERAGIPYLVKDDGDFYFKDGNLIWLRDIDKEVSPEYLYRYLKSYSGQQQLESSMIGSAQKALTIVGLKGLEIPLPPLKDQHCIAEVLGSLDDKIDLLKKQNQTLEQLAETLYRQLFVVEGKEDWICGALGDLAMLYNGKARPQQKGTIPIYGGNGILGYADSWNYTGRSIIIGRVGAYCGSLYYENRNIWVSDNALLAKAKNGRHTHYLYQLLKTLDLNSLAEGSSHPLLTQGLLRSLNVTLPPEYKREQFEDYVDPWYDKIHENSRQIESLGACRDLLLPKLISGEVSTQIQYDKMELYSEETC